jgi:DNA-binding beta-propeller fold protein YncE
VPQIRTKRTIRLVVIAAGGALLLLAAVAFAGPGAITYRGCFANRGAHDCRAPKHDSLQQPLAVAVSPDGRSIYVAGFGSRTSFKRRPDGALGYAGCIANRGAYDCREAAHNSLDASYDVAVSPDGRSVYVTSLLSGLTRFDRAPTGAIKYRGCFANHGTRGCRSPAHPSIKFATDVAVSPDGRSVYVTSYADDSVTRFKRGAHGGLTYAGCFANGGAHGCRDPGRASLNDPVGIAVSPDGGSVYVTGDDVTRFARGARGQLKYRGCIADDAKHGCKRARHDSLKDVYDVEVSSDGQSVYTASYRSDAVTWFKRSPDGKLHYKGCIANGGKHGCRDPNHDSLSALTRLAVSPDGRSVYAVSYRGASITRFKRGAKGALSYGGCVANKTQDGCKRARHPSLAGSSGVAVSPDDRSVYVASVLNDAVTRLNRALAAP